MASPRSVLQAPEEGRLTCVVLGGGVAGLLSAHVACEAFTETILIEGDELQSQSVGSLEASKHRRGIPQYMQPHTLASGGLQAMEALLPGFHRELVRRGGVELDLCRDFRFFDFDSTYARAEESSLKSVGASRHLIQSTLQDEILSRNSGRLRVLQGTRATTLWYNEEEAAVLGVELGNGDRLEADLVIVATGRYSLLPQWLEAGGYERPPEQRVDSALIYSGRLYKIPEDWDGRWKGQVTYGRPHCLKGAGMVPVEGGAWQMAVWGINGVVPPTSEEEFLEYARSLPDPEIYDTVRRSQPLTPLMKHAGACNLQRRYDRICLPEGLIAIGDCVQCLNPVYAQGMSVAAMSACALRKALSAALPAAGPTGAGAHEARRAAVRGMGPAWQRQLATVIEPAWMLATSEDMRYAKTKVEGVPHPPAILSAYVDSLFRACHHDARVLDILFSVAHMTRPPHHLFHPRLLAAGVGQMLREALARWWPASQPTSDGHEKAA